MGNTFILLVAALAAISFVVWSGPLIYLVRACLRLILAPAAVRRWQKPVLVGVAAGTIGATLVSWLVYGGDAAMLVSIIAILTLLAALDFAWRWLPFEWTLPVLGLGLVLAMVQGAIPEALMGLFVGAGTLIALQLFFHFSRGVRALGTGDIWLAAGLGTLSGVPDIAYILSFAAVTGLAGAGLAKLGPFTPRRQRYGVAYGAHLCLAYFFFLIF